METISWGFTDSFGLCNPKIITRNAFLCSRKRWRCKCHWHRESRHPCHCQREQSHWHSSRFGLQSARHLCLIGRRSCKFQCSGGTELAQCAMHVHCWRPLPASNSGNSWRFPENHWYSSNKEASCQWPWKQLPAAETEVVSLIEL